MLNGDISRGRMYLFENEILRTEIPSEDISFLSRYKKRKIIEHLPLLLL